MKKIHFSIRIIPVIIALLFSNVISAGSPVFSFTALTATTLQLLASSSATVQYRVQNNSQKPHTLMMIPTTGITQITTGGNCPNPFVLSKNQSCILTLQIIGSQLSHDIHGGPNICQQGPDGNPSMLFCYQPNPADVLNVSVIPIAQYSITSSAGANGIISPNSSQTVYRGSDLLFTATPTTGYLVYQWFVDGSLVQTGGSTFLLSNITANHTVTVTFNTSSFFYGGAGNGQLYFSIDAGLTWSTTPQTPAGGSPINSVFTTINGIYVGANNGFIYYSTNNGNSWSQTTSPDGSAVNSVFISNNILYAATESGFVHYSGNNGATWNITTSPDGNSVNSIFVTTNTLYHEFRT